MQIGREPSTLTSLLFIASSYWTVKKMSVRREMLREATRMHTEGKDSEGMFRQCGEDWPYGWFCRLIKIFHVT